MALFERMKELADKFNSLKTDRERLVFLKEHNDVMKVVCDNDQTMVEFIQPSTMDDEVFEDMCEELYPLEDFDNYHGWTDGIIELFEFAGITAETC